ncbi:13E12 repeat family protein [Mycobacterium kansasii]|uniref:13E12 repeat family protein n=1 Tax=Mycobacterium kansasii TaxID=1768 RepID=A0A1V3WGS4_MYCKA|nr:13E12 repeat family protein [Mycobacterium kansasii]
MTYAARDETTLPKLPAQMRWVVLVDKRQLAVLLLEDEVPVASATDTLDARGDIDYENQPVDAVERLCRRLADQAVVSGVLCGSQAEVRTRCRRADEAGGVEPVSINAPPVGAAYGFATNLKCYCHTRHLTKTFRGWREKQSPDGTLILLRSRGTPMSPPRQRVAVSQPVLRGGRHTRPRSPNTRPDF